LDMTRKNNSSFWSIIAGHFPVFLSGFASSNSFSLDSWIS
jgi:hypothetical protein